MIASIVLVLAALMADSQPIHIKAAQSAYEQGQRARTDKQWATAAEFFHKAIDIEPTYLEAREALIETYENSGDQLAVAAAVTKYLEINPEASHYRLLLGKILLTEKQPEKALAQFSLVLKKQPLNADGLLGFAAAARQLGMTDRAASALERGRKQYPSDSRFQLGPDKASSGAPE